MIFSIQNKLRDILPFAAACSHKINISIIKVETSFTDAHPIKHKHKNVSQVFLRLDILLIGIRILTIFIE